MNENEDVTDVLFSELAREIVQSRDEIAYKMLLNAFDRDKAYEPIRRSVTDRIKGWIKNMRRRVGHWIAGNEPEDY